MDAATRPHTLLTSEAISLLVSSTKRFIQGSSQSSIKIKKTSSISDRKFVKLLQEIEKEAGQRLFEGNLDKEIA